MLLKDKVVIVTGGGRGIGAAICRALAREGATVAVNYNASEAKAQALAESIKSEGGQAEAFWADVCDADSVRQMIEAVHIRFGRIDSLINNAIGGKQYGSLAELSAEDYSSAFDYGVKAIINTISSVRPIMNTLGGGRIINIVSEQWNFGAAKWSPYMAGKGAMIGISRSLADELGPENITVNMVSPGWMRDEKVEAGPDVDSYSQSVPLRRQGDAEEIGKVCVFLISHLGDFVTGAYIPVAGGNVRQTG